MSLIFKRKSVRSYRDEKVPDDIIENLLKAGMQAPSSCNAQPWEFIVVSNPEDKRAISRMHKFAKPAEKASHLIITIGNLNEAKVIGMIEQDLGAGFHPIEDRTLKLKAYLNIPDHCIPFSVICVGWPAQESEVKLRYDASKVHFDRY